MIMITRVVCKIALLLFLFSSPFFASIDDLTLSAFGNYGSEGYSAGLMGYVPFGKSSPFGFTLGASMKSIKI